MKRKQESALSQKPKGNGEIKGFNISKCKTELLKCSSVTRVKLILREKKYNKTNMSFQLPRIHCTTKEIQRMMLEIEIEDGWLKWEVLQSIMQQSNTIWLKEKVLVMLHGSECWAIEKLVDKVVCRDDDAQMDEW